MRVFSQARAETVKKGLTEGISTSAIDDRDERARKAGACGGKLLGAGTGGFLMFTSRGPSSIHRSVVV